MVVAGNRASSDRTADPGGQWWSGAGPRPSTGRRVGRTVPGSPRRQETAAKAARYATLVLTVFMLALTPAG